MVIFDINFRCSSSPSLRKYLKYVFTPSRKVNPPSFYVTLTSSYLPMPKTAAIENKKRVRAFKKQKCPTTSLLYFICKG